MADTTAFDLDRLFERFPVQKVIARKTPRIMKTTSAAANTSAASVPRSSGGWSDMALCAPCRPRRGIGASYAFHCRQQRTRQTGLRGGARAGTV
jgi:hypothetical protein